MSYIYINIFRVYLWYDTNAQQNYEILFRRNTLREYNENITFRFREKFAHLIRHRT